MWSHISNNNILINTLDSIMQDTQFATFIQSKGYKSSGQFNSNPKSLLRLINFIKNLPIEQQSLDVMLQLLKFYRTPIFITCQSFYQRLAKNKQDVEKYTETLQEIATYVRNYLQNYNLQQLKFFNVAGISKKKKKIPEKSQPEIQFIKYIQSLGQHINKLKKQINNMDPAELRLELDAILAGGLNRKLNTLELNYEQYFKNQADKIYKQYYKKLEGGAQKTSSDKKTLQQRPEFESQKKVPLCCRPFFFDREIIKQPENLVLQYKNYLYPLNQTHIKTLKKTVCGFLNTNGGTIFLGIQQDNSTKKRQVYGMQLNEYQKQQITFTLRQEVMNYIEPDVISNKIYSICFVPVKQKQFPNNYISGRYLTKITIGYGVRNQIYSYKHEDKDYFAFRTENQVIHRYGRDVLNTYRERLKNPLPIPVPVHQGPCTPPDEGRQITSDRVRKQQNFAVKKQQFPSLLTMGTPNSQKQKKKYKQKDAMDFIIMKLTEQQLRIELLNKDLQDSVLITSAPKNPKLCFVKADTEQIRQQIINLFCGLESDGTCQFYLTQRGINLKPEDLSLAQQILSSKKMQFNVNTNKNQFEFKTTAESVDAFVFLKEMKINGISFCGV